MEGDGLQASETSLLGAPESLRPNATKPDPPSKYLVPQTYVRGTHVIIPT